MDRVRDSEISVKSGGMEFMPHATAVLPLTETLRRYLSGVDDEYTVAVLQ